MVFTQCVYELYIVLSHCAQVGSIAEAAHLTIYFLTGVVKVWMADAASICREILSHKEFFQSGEGDSLNDSFEKVIVSLVKGMQALSTQMQAEYKKRHTCKVVSTQLSKE